MRKSKITSAVLGITYGQAVYVIDSSSTRCRFNPDMGTPLLWSFQETFQETWYFASTVGLNLHPQIQLLYKFQA